MPTAGRGGNEEYLSFTGFARLLPTLPAGLCLIFEHLRNYSSLPTAFQGLSYEMCGFNVAVKQC